MRRAKKKHIYYLLIIGPSTGLGDLAARALVAVQEKIPSYHVIAVMVSGESAEVAEALRQKQSFTVISPVTNEDFTIKPSDVIALLGWEKFMEGSEVLKALKDSGLYRKIRHKWNFNPDNETLMTVRR